MVKSTGEKTVKKEYEYDLKKEGKSKEKESGDKDSSKSVQDKPAGKKDKPEKPKGMLSTGNYRPDNSEETDKKLKKQVIRIWLEKR